MPYWKRKESQSAYLYIFAGILSRTTSSSDMAFLPIGAKPPKSTQNSPESDSATSFPSSKKKCKIKIKIKCLIEKYTNWKVKARYSCQILRWMSVEDRLRTKKHPNFVRYTRTYKELTTYALVFSPSYEKH
jgi:hypothetical protein